MDTLVIHTPRRMAEQQGKRSFEATLVTGIGDGFFISASQLQQLDTPSYVILLDKDSYRRAEGTLVGLQPSGWTVDGKQRYDVLMQNMALAPYEDIPLQRWGVAVIMTGY